MEETEEVKLTDHEALLALLVEEIESGGPVGVGEFLTLIGFEAVVAEARELAADNDDEREPSEVPNDPDADEVDDADAGDASDASEAGEADGESQEASGE